VNMSLTVRQQIERDFEEVEKGGSLLDPVEGVENKEGGDDPKPSVNARPDDQSNLLNASPPAEVETLKAEIARLTQRIDDDNNPTWKQRYSSQQGVINSQGEELRTIRAEMADLKRKLEEGPKNPEPEPAKREDNPDYQALEKDLGAAAAKIIFNQQEELNSLKGKFGAVDEELKATKGKTEQIEEATDKIAGHQAQTESEKYASRVATAVPDWDALMGTQDRGFSDQNPKFTEFLQKVVRGKSNFQALADAHQSGDIAVIKEIFDEGRTYAGVALSPEKDREKPTGEQEKPLSKAEQFLEPNKTAASTETNTQQTKRTYTKAERDEFEHKYMAFQRSPEKFKGKESAIESMWNDINAAAFDGRWVG
jgi:hypothetical protein